VSESKVLSFDETRRRSASREIGDRCPCHGLLLSIVPPHDCFTISAWPRSLAVDLYGEEWVKVLG